MWKIEIIEDWDKIWNKQFQTEWLEIMDNSPNAHVFFHPALVKAWVETYTSLRKLDPLFVYGYHKEYDLKVIFPLVRWHQNWKNAFRKLIVPMGYSDFDYHDPIFNHEVSPDIFQSFYEKVFLLLKDYDSIEIDGIHQENIPPNFSISKEEPCSYIDVSLCSSLDEYLGSLDKSVRKNYQRRKKNLETKNFIKYNVYTLKEDYKVIEKILPFMLKTHSERWPQAYKASNFHSNLIKFGLRDQILRFYIIKVNVDFFSWRITFLYKEKLYLYMPTFNPNYMSYSPGIQSLCHCIQDAIENKCHTVDLLRGSETYKKDWSSGQNTILNVKKTNGTSLSSIKEKLIKIKYSLKR